MADDKKNPKEASNIFHSIMKASVSQQPKIVKCDVCGLAAEAEAPIAIGDNKVKVTYKCANGHEFSKTLQK